MKWFIVALSLMMSSIVNAEVDHLARFEHNQQVSYGRIIGEDIQPLSGDLFGKLVPKGQPIPKQK